MRSRSSRAPGPPRALARLGISVAVAAVVVAVTAPRFSWRMVAIGAWVSGGICLLSLAWWTIIGCTAALTRQRAAGEDPGRTTVNVLVLLTSGLSLMATAALVHRAKLTAGAEGNVLVTFSLVNVALCWALTHTAFTLRYAHLYYREDAEGIGGVDFPGRSAPRYLDFAYLAFTVGMCFQVSDLTVTSSQIRYTVLLQAVLSFVYNTAILAFVLNLVFGFAV